MFPQFLRHVRRKRREHEDERFDRFLQHRQRRQTIDGSDCWDSSPRRPPRVCSVGLAARAHDSGALAERVELVDELHLRRYRRVQVHPRVQIQRHAADCLVRLPPKRAFRVVEREIADRWNRCRLPRLCPLRTAVAIAPLS